MSDFGIGLQVTALGMGLVFLTLVIVMLVIMVLDRLFRPKVGGTGATVTAPAAGTALPVEAAVTTSAAPAVTQEADALAEVVAISVAIAATVARRASAGLKTPFARSANPLFVSPDDHSNIPGEVVLVATIDGGSGIWARAGRLQAMTRGK